MQINHDQIRRLEQEWNEATHPEEKRAIYNLAAQHCQDCGHQLRKEGNKWAIASK